MTVPTDVFATYQSIGNREDLSDVIYKISPTELRILLAIGNIRALSHPTTQLFGESYLFFDIGAVVAMSLMAVVLVVSVTRNTIMLYRAERV